MIFGVRLYLIADTRKTAMKINPSSVFVDDQDRALDFYTRVLGLRQEDRASARCGILADRCLAE